MIGFIESCRKGGRWGRGVAGTITRLGRSESDCTGRFYFQAVEVPVAIPVELANEGGVHLPVVEAHIVDLPVKVPTAGGAVATDDQVGCTAGIDGGGA